MKNEGRHSIYFLGIGGIGMSALARFYNARGYAVSGYDRTPSPLTRTLESEGMTIHYDDRPDLIPTDIEFAVYTPAVPRDLSEFVFLSQRNVPILKRAELLGNISRMHNTVAVAGSHGKTTTTALITHLLMSARKPLSAFIGGIANNLGSNVVIGDVNDRYVVAEADEYDRSFLQLSPYISVVTSIGADHLDIYGDEQHLVEAFNSFVGRTSDDGLVVYHEGLPVRTGHPSVTFGLKDADFIASNIRIENQMTLFEAWHGNEKIGDFAMQLFGTHNVMNALASIIVCLHEGIAVSDIARGLATFKGVRRRFDIRVKNSRFCYIDDYAHHPEEMMSALGAVRMLFPDKPVTLVFQPHLFTRTRDLMDDFALSLGKADNLILLDIYPAREKPIEGITSSALLEKVSLADKTLCTKENLLAHLNHIRPELLVTMGAGDIDRFVEPIEQMMKQW